MLQSVQRSLDQDIFLFGLNTNGAKIKERPGWSYEKKDA